MGVLGITPFLQKTCPHVFKTLPDRLRSLSRKTVVIDGTLVTQRLHFAPMPHPHRHLIGWHRILSELRDADVRAICVFDGTQRTAAKAREVERRREARRIEALRGSIERTRLHRLQRLVRLLPYYRSLPATDRQRVNDALRAAHSALDPHVSGSRPPPPRITPQIDRAHFGVGTHDLHDVLNSSHGSDPYYMPPSVQIGSCPSLPSANWNAAMQPTDLLPDSVDSFEAELSALYSEYNQCITQLASMPSPGIPGPQTPADSPDPLDARIDYVMSKQQLQMTLDEGRIWNFLSASVSSPSPESALTTLAERSTAISRSYQRRTNAPTTQTYDESKELLRAMGVPCIQSSGPFEAEALACALVTHGHADYVVSEDTDVLVYEAPMLRGITARESPIVVVHGDAIRTTLQLDRARYVDFALLLGTDFSQRIKHVGPSRALRFIREHGSIERVVELEIRYPPRVPVPDYLAQVGVARLVFQNLPPLPDVGLLEQTREDPDAVSEIVQRYKLHRMLPSAWNTESALAGNYFGDDPSGRRDSSMRA